MLHPSLCAFRNRILCQREGGVNGRAAEGENDSAAAQVVGDPAWWRGALATIPAGICLDREESGIRGRTSEAGLVAEGWG